jgi:hypothetical protein
VFLLFGCSKIKICFFQIQKINKNNWLLKMSCSFLKGLTRFTTCRFAQGSRGKCSHCRCWVWFHTRPCFNWLPVWPT